MGLVWGYRVGTGAEHNSFGFKVLVCLSPGHRINAT